MYTADFIPAREAGYFLEEAKAGEIRYALEADLPRFVPRTVFDLYSENQFTPFLEVVKHVTADLMKQGMKAYFDRHV